MFIYCDKGILYLKSFTYGHGKSFYVEGQDHNLRITLHVESNSICFNLIFGYRRGGQVCPQNIFNSLSMFSTLHSAFSAFFLLLHFLHHSLYYINQPKVLRGTRMTGTAFCMCRYSERGNSDDWREMWRRLIYGINFRDLKTRPSIQ